MDLEIRQELFGESPEQADPAAGRLASIDALRGFDMFWIVGGYYIFAGLHKAMDVPATAFIKKQLTHVEWEGFVFEDLIMPLFLFIVGVVMPFSLNKRQERGHSKLRLYVHIIFRTIVLFVLGMVAAGNLLAFDLSKLRLYNNTLQSIAAGYLIAAVIMLNLRISRQVVVTAALLILFWALMMFVPIPEHGAGVLEQDANLAQYIDKVILGRFDDGLNYTWILSSITFAATVMLGVLAGHLLRSDKKEGAKVVLLMAAGLGCLVLGSLWADWPVGFGKLAPVTFPMIKRLWTSSFTLFAGGLSFVLLALFYLVIDVWGLKKWAFGLVVIGANAIFIYMATHLFSFRHISDPFVNGLDLFVGPWKELIHPLAAFVVIWLIMCYMYRKKTFIKI
ncbi:MAG: DUF5009 domain-containing protein [Sedimentisphaerales bacterium]|nr:DUF5009 domain-containing protein [Sedimentisphaerales bacterium]